MHEVITVPSRGECSAKPEDRGPLSRGFPGLAGWLFSVNADRWRRRAQFYEHHREYFPRLASGSFVERCRELESISRAFARLLFAVPPQDELIPVRVTVSRAKSSRRR